MRRNLLALALGALALAVPTAALADPGKGNGNGPRGDVLHLGKDVKVKKPKKQDAPASVPALTQAAAATASALETRRSPREDLPVIH